MALLMNAARLSALIVQSKLLSLPKQSLDAAPLSMLCVTWMPSAPLEAACCTLQQLAPRRQSYRSAKLLHVFAAHQCCILIPASHGSRFL